MFRKPWIPFVFSLLSLLFAVEESNGNSNPTVVSRDIVIYGGTVCAFTAAITASRMNKTSVIVLEYGDHFGGMFTGGLSAVDLNMPVGGILLEFANRAGMPVTPFPSIEAKVAAATMQAMLKECDDSILIVNNTFGLAYVNTTANNDHHRTTGQPIVSSSLSSATTLLPPRILSLTTHSGQTFTGNYFIDCSYEGDLLQQSGAPFTYGRESSTQYNETLAGSEGYPWTINRYPSSVSPWVDTTTNTTLLPTVSFPPTNQEPGTGDNLVQSYNYRLCLTNNATIAVPLTPPPGYNASYVELLRRWWLAEDQTPTKNLTIGDLFLIRDLPGGLGKIDVNDGNMLFGTDMPFLQRDYPTGNWTVRQSIAAAHEWWIRALFTFLQTDDTGAVPAYVRNEITSYGLCGDEFLSTNHWPPQLYVREAVRLVGDRILTENDVYGRTIGTCNSSIGLSRWLVDIHAEERLAINVSNGRTDEIQWLVADAGHRTTLHDPWQLTEVPYESILPPRYSSESRNNSGSLANFLVPVCTSMSHVAFATYRLESQYAIMGQSAAVAAVLAMEANNLDLHDLNITVLQEELVRQGQIINATQPPPPPSTPALILQPCSGNGTSNASNPSQLWSYVTADSTIRLSSSTAIDPTTSVYILSREEDPGAWESPRTGLLSPAERLLRGGRHVRGSLSEICASVFGYRTTSGTPIWAVTCHTNDTNPAHQNQEYDIVVMDADNGNTKEDTGMIQIRSKLSGLCLMANLSSMEVVQGECSSSNSRRDTEAKDRTTLPAPNTLWLPLAETVKNQKKNGSIIKESVEGLWQLAPSSRYLSESLCVTMP